MTTLQTIKKYTRKGAIVLKNEGILIFGIKALKKLQKKRAQITTNPQLKKKFISLVDRENVMAADWSTKPYVKKSKKTSSPYTINWVMSPPSVGGGHQNIFRFISLLDGLGHKNNIYLYSTFDDTTIAQAKDNIKSYSTAKNLTFKRYDGEMVPSDIIFATGWETAYPVFNDTSDARKMYFVQDFEPYFYPMGTDYILAENTYRFGFHGVTAGGWLHKKLNTEYNMTCDHYDFGADKNNYKFTNPGVRKEVFFYARPVTERRAFDLGLMALELFHKRMPEYTINLAGWDVSEWDVPFPYVNHGTMRLDELSDLYNKCAVALVLSLTNMSLLPLELLASGVIPVVNDGENNRLVSNSPYIAYTQSSPEALAQEMIDVISKKDLPAHAKKASDSISSNGWEEAGKEFIKAIEKELGNV